MLLWPSAFFSNLTFPKIFQDHYLTVPRRYIFCGSFMFFVLSCLLCLRTRLFICALWSPAGKGLTSWLSFVVSYCEFVTLGRVWYLIVSIPDLCTLTYFHISYADDSYEIFSLLWILNRSNLVS